MKRHPVRAFLTLLALLPALEGVAAPAQEPAVVTGQVTSASGAPESAVVVRIEALNVGAVTAGDGRYRLVIPAERIPAARQVTITASRIGLATVQRIVTLSPGAQVTQNFTMGADVLSLEALVATAHGESQRREVRSSVAVLESAAASAGVPNPPPPSIDQPRVLAQGGNTENYAAIEENPFLAVGANPLSTFSIDVDPASYSNVRRFLRQGLMPPKDAVRIEELVNYFDYAYPDPSGEHPFAVVSEVGECPWNRQHLLVHVGLQGKRVATADLPPSNLVFLVDVSGSMAAPNKLPLVQQSLRLLVEQLRPQDRVAMVVYAGAAGLVLDATPGSRKSEILEAIDRLQAGGSTAGGAGLRLAYDVAARSHVRGGNNRVILATDGDFNVGVSSDAEMFRLIEEKREQGTFLTVLGYGMGNLKDNKLEGIADRGNGNYAYIDDIQEAEKVLVSEMGGTLFTIAKDVKLQIEFNPERVAAYRLIGYENRVLRDEDFNDDRKDAGELGAGHSVTALYEVVPVGADSDARVRGTDPLRYRRPSDAPVASTEGNGRELMFVKLRYKQPDQDESRLLSHAIEAPAGRVRTSDDFRFSAAVASFGMLLRGSEHKGRSSVDHVLSLARGARGDDADGYRGEFIRLVQSYQRIAPLWAEPEDGRRGR